MAAPIPAAKMRAWQYTTTEGGIEKNLKLNPDAPVPTPKPKQNLVKVIAMALNPADYKNAEASLISRLLISKPATPGLDFAGQIITSGTESPFKADQLVFGVPSKWVFNSLGSLCEYTLADNDAILAIPDGVSLVDAAALPVTGLTAYQSVALRVKNGDKIFINGGSGGVGVLGIQMAKLLGCYVATSCSTANVELCKSLGADEVIDYKKGSVLEALTASGRKYDHVVDNVGNDWGLFWGCHNYTTPDAVFIRITLDMTLENGLNLLRKKAVPAMLGGAKRKGELFWPDAKLEDLSQVIEWVKEGKVRVVIDQKFLFEQAPEAFAKLKTGRAKGKIMVDVASA
ncbi:putative zinc-type alcohol dehydrogenase-like protein C16A3.02c [Stipitochalara longipes BDJ]|nr:putative zinc-type alcohol dehydrogenase-like protein C16A3.02c [Stipitochalara longipes BDJ]